MQLLVLGPVEVVAEAARLSLGSGRQRTILAVLLASDELLSTDRLVEAVWGRDPPSAAATTLRSHISQLRRRLERLEVGGGSAIVTDSGGYRLVLGDHSLDAAIFERAVGRAVTALHDDPAAALELLDAALARWRGRAFGELGDHPMVRAAAVRLERLQAGAVADRVDARLALGRYGEAVGELEARVVTEPFDERAHGQLMMGLYRSGRQAAALAVYEALRGRLRDELGIDPSPDLQRLHGQVLRQEFDDTDDRSPSVSADSPDRRSLRPASGSSLRPAGPHPELFGRDEATEAVAELVVAHPLVTIIGPGGVGKTRLAERVGREVVDRFDDGVFGCELSAVREPESVVAALVVALGIEHPGTRDAREELAAAIGERRLLLILDNCEHLLASVAGTVEALSHRCPHLGVLSTSREPLRVPGERVWQLAPLATPRPGADCEQLLRSPAGALFVTRAEAADPTFALTEETAAPVAELCRRLDGLPLAIELAAARTRALAPAALAARLDQRFSLLSTGPAGGPDRHRTLEAMVEWSHDLLDDAQARLFNRLSVFAGAFSLQAAEQVCGNAPLTEVEVAGLLADLVDRSMVSVERDDPQLRYRLLDTLRAYGAQRLTSTDEVAACRRAHAMHHVALVEELGPRLRGRHEGLAVATIEATIDDLRIAHSWLVNAGDVDAALRLSAALHEYLLFRLRSELFQWAERALQMSDAEASPGYPSALATAALGAANRGALELAHRRAEEALERGEGIAALRALATLSAVALYEGRADEVLALGDQLTALAETCNEPYYAALSHLDPSLVLFYRGEHAAAAARATELEAAAEAAHCPTVRAWAAYLRGEISMDSDPPTARRHLMAAVQAAREADSHLPEGVALTSLASLATRTSDHREALRRFRDAVQLWRRLGDHTHQLTTVRNLVELLVELGVDDDAALLYGAVVIASPPSFGAEADRLERDGVRLEERLGAEALAGFAHRGQRLGPEGLPEAALATLDRLLEA
jgi:predicted ATPase/DNA-binding SARP family transcriptional activator